jgi:hypothetical protein
LNCFFADFSVNKRDKIFLKHLKLRRCGRREHRNLQNAFCARDWRKRNLPPFGCIKANLGPFNGSEESFFASDGFKNLLNLSMI